MRLDKQRVLAVVLTVLVHAVLFAVLTQQDFSRSQPNDEDDDEALHVVWIDPPEERRASTVAKAPESTPKKTISEPARPTKNDMASDEPKTNQSLLAPEPAPKIVADDDWSLLSGESPRYDAPSTGSFERNPLAGRDTSGDAQSSRLKVEVRDRSFGGWVQRQTKRNICSDLKRQLTNAQGGSADTIVATMGRYGCKI